MLLKKLLRAFSTLFLSSSRSRSSAAETVRPRRQSRLVSSQRQCRIVCVHVDRHRDGVLQRSQRFSGTEAPAARQW